MSWPPVHDRAVPLRAHLDHAGWAHAVRAVCERHGLPFTDPRMFDTGSDVVFGVGDHVVKLTAPCWAQEIAAEVALLGHVGGKLPVATPQVVAHGTLDGWPYVVMSRLPGTQLADVWPKLAGADRRDLAAELGGVVRALHALPVVEGVGPAWSAFLDENRRAVVKNHGAHVSAQALDAWLAAHPPPDRPAVTLHTEVLDQHVFVEEHRGRWRVSALIDFADGRAGHPGYELPGVVELLLRGERGGLRAFLDGYGRPWPVDEHPDEAPRQLLSWTLLHRFGRIGRVVAAAPEVTPVTLEGLAAAVYSVDPVR